MMEAMMMGAGAKDNAVAVEDAFSTTLYTGNSSTQTITNGIDLAGEGGLVWGKDRNNSYSHWLLDTGRGVTSRLSTNTTDAENTSGSDLSAFNSDGFSLQSTQNDLNASGDSFVSWTFRQAPAFFDIVSYTGDGTSGRQIAHDLGAAPGMIITKRTNNTSNWIVWHKSFGNTDDYLMLNGTYAKGSQAGIWGSELPNESYFSIDSSSNNQSGSTYIAYLFAHDPSDSGIIQCGSYTGNGSTTGPVIDLGWEPQWLLIKSADNNNSWVLYDSERDNTNPNTLYLQPNASTVESNNAALGIDFNPTGFQIKGDNVTINGNTANHIYMVIRAPE